MIKKIKKKDDRDFKKRRIQSMNINLSKKDWNYTEVGYTAINSQTQTSLRSR